MPIFIKFIEPQLKVQGPLQQFIFDDIDPLGTFQVWSQFIPIPTIDSNVQIDLLNFSYSGYRMGLDTSSSTSSGMWHLSQLVWNNNGEKSNYSLTPLITFNKEGNNSFDFNAYNIGGVKDPVLLQDVVTLNYFKNNSGGGALTSVGLNCDSQNLTITNSPITSSGTINIDLGNNINVTSINTSIITMPMKNNFIYTVAPPLSGSGVLDDLSIYLPNTQGNPGWVLTTNGKGTTSWLPQSGGVTSVGLTNTDENIYILNSPITTSGNIGINLNSDPVFSSIALGIRNSGRGWILAIPNTLKEALTLTLPNNSGANGQVLSTDGQGNTSWANNGALTSYYLLTKADLNLPNATVLPVINTGIYSSAISGSGNLYIGTSSGSSGVIHDNIGLGYQTLDFLSNNSAYNIAIGPQALQKAINSQGNTVIGYQSMANLSTDSTGTYYNTAIGYQTFLNLTGPIPVPLTPNNASINNIAIGYQAGSTKSSYQNCTFLGANADAGQTGLIQATAIGTNTIVNQSWSIALGSEQTSCRVGIGIAAPKYSLHIGNTTEWVGNTPFLRCGMLISSTTNPLPVPTRQYDVCLWAAKGSTNGALFIQSNTGGVYKLDSTNVSEPASEPKIPVLTADEIQALTSIAIGAIVYDTTNDTAIIHTAKGWANLVRSEYNPQN